MAISKNSIQTGRELLPDSEKDSLSVQGDVGNHKQDSSPTDEMINASGNDTSVSEEGDESKSGEESTVLGQIDLTQTSPVPAKDQPAAEKEDTATEDKSTDGNQESPIPGEDIQAGDIQVIEVSEPAIDESVAQSEPEEPVSGEEEGDSEESEPIPENKVDSHELDVKSVDIEEEEPIASEEKSAAEGELSEIPRKEEVLEKVEPVRPTPEIVPVKSESAFKKEITASEKKEKAVQAKAKKAIKISPVWKKAGVYFLTVLVLVGVLIVLNYMLLGMCFNTLDVHNNDALRTTTPSFSMLNPFFLRSLTFRLDGSDVKDRVKYKAGNAIIDFQDLSQGPHVLEIGFKGDYNPLTLISRRHCVKFEVDTIRPAITLDTPTEELIRRKDFYVIGETEPDIRYNIIMNGKAHAGITDSGGNFYARVEAGKEINKLRILVSDRAGNRGKIFRTYILDESPPKITLPRVGDEDGILKANGVSLNAEVYDTGSGVDYCHFEVDGEMIDGLFDPSTGNLTAEMDKLDAGRYEIGVVATDRAGWKIRKTIEFIVDTRETLGDAKVRPGAIGKDVEIIQQKLVKMGLLDEKKMSGKFNNETRNAVINVQEKRGLPADGIVDRATFLAMTEKIEVYLNEFSLYLLSPDGILIKKYPIACGSPYYPTPPGKYFVKEKIYHPPWIPPKSGWAKGAKPVPPGPGNPLGTRWIGLNANIVGIHGTPSSWSIGSASSHGCIRMYIPDAEELFEKVNIGTPVTIFGSRPVEMEEKLTTPKLQNNNAEQNQEARNGEEI